MQSSGTWAWKVKPVPGELPPLKATAPGSFLPLLRTGRSFASDLALDDSTQLALITAARDAKQVEGLTHCHYNYFSQLDAGLRSLEAIADHDTTLVQVVAFAEPDWQLDRYLSVAANAGWEELFLPLLRDEEDGRLWRSVPNRKWHAVRRGQTGGSREVVLFHRLRQM